jgi:hypothetical protein
MRRGIILILSIAIFCFTGCENKEYKSRKKALDDAKKENASIIKEAESLEAKVQNLKNEIEKFKNSPERILKRGQFYFKAKAWDHAKETLNRLKEKFPGSEEAKKAEELLADLDTQLNKIAKKKKALAMQALKRLRKIKTGNMVHYGGLPGNEAINAHIIVDNGDWSKAIMILKIEMVAYEKWTVKEITVGTRNGPHVITDSATKCTHTSAERGKTRTTYLTAVGLKEKYMIEDIIARGGARITFTAHYDVDVGFDLSNKALKHLRDVFLVYDGLCGRYN